MFSLCILEYTLIQYGSLQHHRTMVDSAGVTIRSDSRTSGTEPSSSTSGTWEYTRGNGGTRAERFPWQQDYNLARVSSSPLASVLPTELVCLIPCHSVKYERILLQPSNMRGLGFFCLYHEVKQSDGLSQFQWKVSRTTLFWSVLC